MTSNNPANFFKDTFSIIFSFKSKYRKIFIVSYPFYPDGTFHSSITPIRTTVSLINIPNILYNQWR
jgi:hypothetical protein